MTIFSVYMMTAKVPSKEKRIRSRSLSTVDQFISKRGPSTALDILLLSQVFFWFCFVLARGGEAERGILGRQQKYLIFRISYLFKASVCFGHVSTQIMVVGGRKRGESGERVRPFYLVIVIPYPSLESDSCLNLGSNEKAVMPNSQPWPNALHFSIKEIFIS